MTNPQGTQWETEIVNMAHALGFQAQRYPKRGQGGEPDVWIGHPEGANSIPIVAWKRLVKTGGVRRQPDGERDVIIMRTKDFAWLLHFVQEAAMGGIGGNTIPSFDVQCKWTERLNVTRVLGDLVSWLKNHRKEWKNK